MEQTKLEKLLDDLTAGLKADPEVRLDVKSELRSHFEEKLEEGLRSGLSEAESEEQALKTFGDLVSVSDGIADADTVKMSLRGKLRFLAGALLIPSVIICAFISFSPATLQVNISPDYPESVFLNSSRFADSNQFFWFLERYTPDEKLILYGDQSKKSPSEQQKAIWKRFPENKVYLANYIIRLLDDRGKDQAAWDKTMASALETAKRLDPENAFYDYLTAGLLVKKGCVIESKSKQVVKNGKKTTETEYSITVKDRKLMDRAVEAYLEGSRKKYYRTCVMDMLHHRLDIMGQPRTVSENIRQIAFSAGTLLPYLENLRNMDRSIWLYAESLQQEGNQQEALRIIAPWKTFLKQTTEDAGFLIDVLVDEAMARLGEKTIPEMYRKAGETESAESAARELKKILEPYETWKAERHIYSYDRERLEKTGALAALLLPALGSTNFSDEDFAVSRKIEYTALEKFGVALLNALMMIFMTGALLTALYWRLRSGQKALLLAPSAAQVGRVLLLGVILPLAIYLLISISGMPGGHEYNIVTNCIALGAQFLLLLAVIPALIFVMVRRHIRRRCLELGIEYPASGKSWTERIIGGAAILYLLVLAVLPLHFSSLQGPFSASVMAVAGAGIVLASAYLILLAAKYLHAILSDRKYALYYGALAKTLAPVLALAIIFLTLAVIPGLEWRESDLIGKDKILYGQPRNFSKVEYLVVQKLKNAMLQAME